MATAPAGEGILPSRAPPGAFLVHLRNQCALRRIARARCPRPQVPSLAAAARTPWPAAFYGACLLARPCNGDGPWGRGHLALARTARRVPGPPSNRCALRRIARARCPRSRRQARSWSIFEPMRLAAHSEGKMPSPPGPVGGRGRSRPLARRFLGRRLLARPAMATLLGGEGILPSLAARRVPGPSSNRCALRRIARARCPRPQGLSLAETARTPWHAVSAAQASGAPLQW